MAAGCALVCSATPPVEEVLENNSSALLVDFFPLRSKRRLGSPAHDPVLRFSLAAEAKKRASGYQCADGLKAWMRLLSAYSDQTAP